MPINLTQDEAISYIDRTFRISKKKVVAKHLIELFLSMSRQPHTIKVVSFEDRIHITFSRFQWRFEVGHVNIRIASRDSLDSRVNFLLTHHELEDFYLFIQDIKIIV